jgi:DNA primase
MDLVGMDLQKEGFSLDRIREIDLAGYLAGLGYEPVSGGIKKNGTDCWYLSPLHAEGEASFHVNTLTNSWYDFSLAAGGNMIDFCLRYYNCSIRELLAKFNDEFSAHLLPVFRPELREGLSEDNRRLVVTDDRPLQAWPLKNYLQERLIPLAVAGQYCREVSYETGGHSYYGIGFKNDAGGYEIRNRAYKLSSAPKDITTINHGADQVQVFEGFFDLLTFKVMHLHQPENAFDLVVLNGAGLFERARPVLERYGSIGLWLDRDATGLAYTKYALSLSHKYEDKSNLYDGYKDLNDWLAGKQMTSRPRLKPKNRLKPGS